jgi:glycosyltransferase involved in cell wall biosynthesis
MHINNGITFGGCETMLLAIAEGLQRRGATDNVCLFLYGLPNMPSSPAVKIISPGWPVLRSYTERLLFAPHTLFLALRFMLAEKPDIIYVYSTSIISAVALPLLARMFGIKIVVQQFVGERSKPVYRRFADSISYSLSHRTVTFFRKGAEELERMGLPAEKISCIPNCKDLSVYRPSDRQAARESLGLDDGDFIIGTVSRLAPVKNHIAVISALPRLLKANPRVKFVVVGDDDAVPYKEYLKQKISELGLTGKVLFLGYRNDITRVFPAFDVFVHPSLAEGVPGAVMEAMCAGLPVVASDVDGTPDLVDDCGILVPPDDHVKLAEALEKLMGDARLRTRYGKKARERIERQFSSEKMLQAYETLFLELKNGSQI